MNPAERDLRYCSCDNCGSSVEIYFDRKHDEYICQECLDKEMERLAHDMNPLKESTDEEE